MDPPRRICVLSTWVIGSQSIGLLFVGTLKTIVYQTQPTRSDGLTMVIPAAVTTVDKDMLRLVQPKQYLLRADGCLRIQASCLPKFVKHQVLQLAFLNFCISSRRSVRSFRKPAMVKILYQLLSMDYTIGPYYSTGNLPNICYSMYSLWGKPNKKVGKMQKGEKIKMSFNLDITGTKPRPRIGEPVRPSFNLPRSAGVQIVVHPPEYIPSPFTKGVGLLGGKSYDMQLKMEANHLLPSPYQTNCTDYMKDWRENEGIGPLSPMMVIEECKMNVNLERRGCVPLDVEYSHNLTVCRDCSTRCKESIITEDNCTHLLKKYNQPCDFTTYHMSISEKLIPIVHTMELTNNETMEVIQDKKGYNCSANKAWQTECLTVDLEIKFDTFQVTNISYNAKFESLELFSVIGGYMGMYLGVSLIAVYDLIEYLGSLLLKFTGKVKVQKKRKMKKRSYVIEQGGIEYKSFQTNGRQRSLIRRQRY